MENKNNARNDFINVIKKSWTYDLLSEYEQIKIINLLTYLNIAGTYKQRYEQLNNCYSQYLDSVDYQPHTWTRKKFKDNLLVKYDNTKTKEYKIYMIMFENMYCYKLKITDVIEGITIFVGLYETFENAKNEMEYMTK